MAGAPLGNDNATKGKEFRQALKRAIARKHGTVSEGLEKIASRLVEAAERDEGWALKEVADRFDGKPAQALIGGETDDPPLKVEGLISLVRPDSAG